MATVPFYFMSDHDIYGFDIYQGLKFGSKESAWASPTLTCSSLQWAGPTLGDLEASITKYTSTHRARALKADSRVSEAAGAPLEAQWLETAMTTLRSRMANKAVSEEAEV